MGETKLFYLDFISVKFSYSNERVSFMAMGVEHKKRTQRMSRAPNLFNNMPHRKSGYCHSYAL